jgi:hypothetical protein
MAEQATPRLQDLNIQLYPLPLSMALVCQDLKEPQTLYLLWDLCILREVKVVFLWSVTEACRDWKLSTS